MDSILHALQLLQLCLNVGLLRRPLQPASTTSTQQMPVKRSNKSVVFAGHSVRRALFDSESPPPIALSSNRCSSCISDSCCGDPFSLHAPPCPHTLQYSSMPFARALAILSNFMVLQQMPVKQKDNSGMFAVTPSEGLSLCQKGNL